MSRELLLGIDIGTYASKGVIVDNTGAVICTASMAHGLDLPNPGWAEHDSEKVWWNDFCHLTSVLFNDGRAKPSEIVAVACSGIGPALLPIDKTGSPLRPAILYGIDTRATEEIAELEARFGQEQIRAVTGNVLSSQSVGPKILWLSRHEPEVFNQTSYFLTSTGYLVFRLTGNILIDNYTAVTFAPLFNINTLNWDKEMCEGIVGTDMLPQPAWSGEIAGKITEEAAKLTGLVAGTPVVVGTTDAAAEALSVGVTEPGELMIMYGTTSFLIQVVDQLIIEPRLWPGVFLSDKTWALAAGMATSGAITRWFRDQFAPLELQNEEGGGMNAYLALSKRAAEVPPGSEGLLILPYFSGERTPINDPLARGVIAGLTLSHSRQHVFRAILEAIAYGINHNLQVIGETGVTIDRVVAVGGGTNNYLWLQIVSDVAGVEQEIPAVTIGAAYGDAFLGGLGIGMFKDLSNIKVWVRPAAIVMPNLENAAQYQNYFLQYRDLYINLKTQLHDLARLSSG
jgi:xylulokinase